MIKKMNLVRPALFAALLCGASAASVLAQDPASPNPGAPGPLITPPLLLPLSSPPPPPPRMQHQGPPRSNPLFDALDTNHDGVISADEINNASASLKTLLKNGSDRLTRDDLRPTGPPPAAPGNPNADEAGKPRPKIGAIRPHGPPLRDEENPAAEPAGPRMRPPASHGDQASEDFDRPHRWHEEGMRENRRPFPMNDEMDDDARPRHQHERLSRHEGPPRTEADEMSDDVRPHHPDSRSEDQEMRPFRAPRPPGPMGEEAGPRAPHHGPPPMPLFDALDTNHDGTISADEIANASNTLKGLLKNGSDHLTRDDLRPTGPPPAGR